MKIFLISLIFLTSLSSLAQIAMVECYNDDNDKLFSSSSTKPLEYAGYTDEIGKFHDGAWWHKRNMIDIGFTENNDGNLYISGTILEIRYHATGERKHIFREAFPSGVSILNKIELRCSSSKVEYFKEKKLDAKTIDALRRNGNL